MAKPKVCTVWLEGCSGCHMSFLDLDEQLLPILEAVELSVTPVTDFKDFDFPDADLGIIEGAAGNEEHVHILKKLRKKCKLLMAWGDCAVFGGINAMRNGISVQALLREGYGPETGALDQTLPVHEDLPVLLPRIQAVNEIVEVDIFVPGCPPSPEAIAFALNEVLSGRKTKLPASLIHFD